MPSVPVIYCHSWVLFADRLLQGYLQMTLTIYLLWCVSRLSGGTPPWPLFPSPLFTCGVGSVVKLALCCVLHDAIRLAASPPSHANPAIANGRGRHGQWNEPQPPGWYGKIDIYIASGDLSSFRMVVCTFSSSSSSSSSTLTTLPAVYFSQLVHH